MELLNEIGGRNAVGRIDLVENRFVGIKSRGCYETPGGTSADHRAPGTGSPVPGSRLMHYKQHVGLKYAELVYFGLWFTPLREALDAFVESTQSNITGTVTLALQGKPVGRAPEIGLLPVSDRSLLIHDGRKLRSERRCRFHPNFGPAFSVARTAAPVRWRSEDVVGPVPAAA